MGAMAAIPLVMAVAGTAMSAAGSIQQGNAQAASANYQSQVAANNAIISEQNAQAATAAGEAAVQSQQRRTASTIGATRTIQGASGLEVNSGSNAAVQNSESELGNLDALTIRNTYARTAYGYRAQGNNYTAQAALDEASAKNSQLSGYMGAIGSIVGGGSSVASKWSSFQQAGAMDGFSPSIMS